MDRLKYSKMILSIPGWHYPADFFETAKVLEKVLSKAGGTTEKNFLEIGIYQGRSFLPVCDYFYNDIDTFYACDYFHDPAWLSGFTDSLKKYLPTDYNDKVNMIRDDSMNLSKHFPENQKKFIYCSIDGDHTYSPLMADIKFCAERLVDEGIIILDDTFQYMWPEVTNAMFNFLYEHKEFKVGFILYNKVILCRNSELIEELYDPAIYDRCTINGHQANVIKSVPDDENLAKVEGFIPRLLKRFKKSA